MKTKKILALALCAVMLVGASVAGTLAYLKASTEVVHNTFTVGNVSFDLDSALDEALVDPYGVPSSKTETEDEEGNKVVTWDEVALEEAERVTENQYKLIPGHTYTKDPIIHMADDSEDAYVFVEVVDGLAAIEDDTTIAAQMTAKGWAQIAENSTIWCKVDENGKPVAVAGGADVPVFDNFTLKNDADVSRYETAEITIKAYAVQADGWETTDTPADIYAEAFPATTNK